MWGTDPEKRVTVKYQFNSSPDDVRLIDMFGGEQSFQVNRNEITFELGGYPMFIVEN